MIYMSTTADPQAVLDEHVLSASTDRCLTCDTIGCPARRQALATLAAWQRLPQRRPGATRPEHIGVRRVA